MDNGIYIMPRSKSEHVAHQLLEKIIETNLDPGSSIGTEADLLQQFDVSRPTLRESLRILESQGVLELRPGPGGGIMVRKPSVEILAHGVSVYLRLNDVPFIAVLKAREVIEPALASEAALHGTDEDFDEMQASIDRMKTITDQEAFIEENRTFHSVIARASRNEVLEVFWSTISMIASGELYGVRYSGGNQKHVIEAHQAIVDACRARNNKIASEKMEAHVAELEVLVRKRYKNLMSQPTKILVKRGQR